MVQRVTGVPVVPESFASRRAFCMSGPCQLPSFAPGRVGAVAVEQMRRARRTPAAVAEAQAGAQVPSRTAEPEAERGEILASHHYADRA
jgi:hypothetical protein